ncbi:hypothetical protein BLS_003265 [Venturia inaequalis]|uniref:Uncharacterized protein n=1 Tax=Venturia inaequalis TaxID=5025 RepID=A0A8H3UQU9_VENIN|nr:hypothetical protein EG328_006649 [Venturia inaequalis]KAE9974115.1 hypothetical protein BLS_003265 [Venturia inaequalis]KAE9994673.1 hypothetical protein EG327_005119 [Venturia inaequalis]
MAEASRKRAHSSDDGPNKRPKTESASSRPSREETIETDRNRKPPVEPKPPLTFLSLPREIRQKILIDSELFEDAYDQDMKFMNNFSIFRSITLGKYDLPCRIKAPNLESVASILAAVHPTIKEDMTYLLRKHLEKIEQYDDAQVLEDQVPKVDRWYALLDCYPDDPKRFCKAIHYIVSSIEPVAIGCWKCWKYNNWKGTMQDAAGIEEPDESDLEEEVMEDDEWYQHMTDDCDCPILW